MTLSIVRRQEEPACRGAVEGVVGLGKRSPRLVRHLSLAIRFRLKEHWSWQLGVKVANSRPEAIHWPTERQPSGIWPPESVFGRAFAEDALRTACVRAGLSDLDRRLDRWATWAQIAARIPAI